MNRVQRLASIPKSMGLDIDNQAMVMDVLNGLPTKYDYTITALDAFADAREFKLDVIEIGLLREEQRSAMRSGSSHDESVLVSTSTRSDVK